MKKFLLGGMITLLVILFVSTGVLAFVAIGQNQTLVTKENNIRQLLEKVNSLENQPAPKPEDDKPKMMKFQDIGEMISIEYPEGWVPEMDVDISNDFAVAESGDASGILVDKYEMTMKKGDTVLTYAKLLGGVGGVDIILAETEKYEILEQTIVRVLNDGVWTYGDYVPTCASESGCSSPFFPAKKDIVIGAVTVTLEGASEELLPEVDAMVLSMIK